MISMRIITWKFEYLLKIPRRKLKKTFLDSLHENFQELAQNKEP